MSYVRRMKLAKKAVPKFRLHIKLLCQTKIFCLLNTAANTESILKFLYRQKHVSNEVNFVSRMMFETLKGVCKVCFTIQAVSAKTKIVSPKTVVRLLQAMCQSVFVCPQCPT